MSPSPASLTILEVPQKGFDPLDDDVGGERHTTDRVKEGRADLLADPLQMSIHMRRAVRLTGNDREMTLSHTSFSASWAKACTPEEGMREHQNHRTDLTAIVASIVAIPMLLRSAGSPCPDLMTLTVRCRASMKTWAKETIMTTEKMSTPRGSNLLLPAGYFPLSDGTPIAQDVPRMMNVERRSRAESTSEATSEIDDE